MKNNYWVVLAIIVLVSAVLYLFCRSSANRQYRVYPNEFDVDTGNYKAWHTQRKALNGSRFIFQRRTVYLTEDKLNHPPILFSIDTGFTQGKGDSLITILNGRVKDQVYQSLRAIKIITLRTKSCVTLNYFHNQVYANYYFDTVNSSLMNDYQLLFSKPN